MTFNNYKSDAELRAMTSQALRSRLKDVSTTLAQLRKAKKRGQVNPRVFSKLKAEKKVIKRVMEEKGFDY